MNGHFQRMSGENLWLDKHGGQLHAGTSEEVKHYECSMMMVMHN